MGEEERGGGREKRWERVEVTERGRERRWSERERGGRGREMRWE